HEIRLKCGSPPGYRMALIKRTVKKVGCINEQLVTELTEPTAPSAPFRPICNVKSVGNQCQERRRVAFLHTGRTMSIQWIKIGKCPVSVNVCAHPIPVRTVCLTGLIHAAEHRCHRLARLTREVIATGHVQ